MSLLTACGGSALRGAVLALSAIPVCLWLVRFLKSTRAGTPRSPTRLAWALLLIPFLTPDLLVGYAYGNFSPFPLVRHPWLCELLYFALLWMKLVPVGIVAVYFSPPSPLTPEAIHCRRLTDGERRRVHLGDFIRGPLRQVFPAAGLMFLLTFQEFELGSLLGITAGRTGSPASWTRVLFDDQQGVIDRLAPLRWALWPLTFELAVLVPLLWLVTRSSSLTAGSETTPRPMSPLARCSTWCCLSMAVALVSVVPLVCVLRESAGALAALSRSAAQLGGLFREIFVGVAFASVAGVLAYALAAHAFVVQPSRLQGSGGTPAPQLLKPQFLTRQVLKLLLVPGLAGSLIVGLSLLYLFQTDFLHLAYDTPLPLVVALVLFLAPRAFLLQVLLRAAQPGEPAELARLLARSSIGRQRSRAGSLLWALQRQRHFWAGALLAFWAYWDLTSAAMLHPSSMVPAPVRLYNLMHYGHNAVLSTMTLLAIAVPLLLAWLVASVLRPLSGRFV